MWWYPRSEMFTQNHAQSTALEQVLIYKKNLDQKFILTKKLEHFEIFAKRTINFAKMSEILGFRSEPHEAIQMSALVAAYVTPHFSEIDSN